MRMWTPLLTLAILTGGCGTPKSKAIEGNDAAAPVTETLAKTPPPEPDADSKKPGSHVPPLTGSVPAGRMEGGFFITDDAPAPRACATDEDCKGDTVPDRTGCCQAPTQVVAHSRAYAAWVHKWRADSCAEVTCPPPPNPSRPPDCLFDVSCVESVCTNGCPARGH